MRSSHVYSYLHDVYFISYICEVLGKQHFIRMASEIVKLNTDYSDVTSIVYRIVLVRSFVCTSLFALTMSEAFIFNMDFQYMMVTQ